MRPIRLAPMRLAPPLLIALALAGCGARESRVEAGLTKAGLAPGMAACLAPRLADRLSDDQLRALARAPEGGGAGLAGIVARVAATGDPAIVDAVSSAALHCAVR